MKSNFNNVRGKPTLFKNLKIYPVKMRDYEKFMEVVTILTFNKNIIANIRIIQMSYLDFLMELNYNDKTIYDKLVKLLTLVLKNQDFEIQISNDNKYKILVYPENTNSDIKKYIEPITLSGYDFNKIRTIILDQNLIPYDDTIVDAEIYKSLNEALEFQAKKNKNSTTIEDQIISYHCYTKESFEEIDNMTIYQFKKCFERIDHFFIVNSYMMAWANGNFEPEQLERWDKHIKEQGLYDSVMIKDEEVDDLLGDIKSVNN